MLIGIHPLLSPELLHVLALMGHTDEIVIANGNYPGASRAKRLIHLPGQSVPDVVRAILTVFPLDDWVEAPVTRMAVIDAVDTVPDVIRGVESAVCESGQGPARIGVLERFAFYERTSHAFAIVMTSELRRFSNVILTKGLLAPKD